MEGEALAAAIAAFAGLITAVGGVVQVMRQTRREDLAACMQKSIEAEETRRRAVRHIGLLEQHLYAALLPVPARPDELY